jgi:hypothetical protein
MLNFNLQQNVDVTKVENDDFVTEDHSIGVNIDEVVPSAFSRKDAELKVSFDEI